MLYNKIETPKPKELLNVNIEKFDIFYIVGEKIIFPANLGFEIRKINKKFDIILWVGISRNEFENKIKYLSKYIKLEMEVELLSKIPFYTNCKDMDFKVLFELDKDFLYPKLNVVNSLNCDLLREFNTGIPYEKYLKWMLDIENRIKLDY